MGDERKSEVDMTLTLWELQISNHTSLKFQAVRSAQKDMHSVDSGLKRRPLFQKQHPHGGRVSELPAENKQEPSSNCGDVGAQSIQTGPAVWGRKRLWK